MQKIQQHIGRNYLLSVGYHEVKPQVFELRHTEFSFNKWLNRKVSKTRLVSRLVIDGAGRIISQQGVMPMYARIDGIRRRRI